MAKIKWDEIEDSANDLVGIWMHGKDKEWLKHTWKVLEKEKLTSYTNEIEKTHVLANLVFLSVLYHEFNGAAYDEGGEFTLSWHIDRIEFNRFRVAQIVGIGFIPDEEIDEDELYWQALQKLVESKRSLIIKALYNYYKTDIKLLDSFLHYTDSDSLIEYDEDEKVYYYDYNRTEVEMALQWISNGLNSIINY